MRRPAKRRDQQIGAGAAGDQVQLKLHLLLGRSNGGEHARKELWAIEQQFKLIADAPREDHWRDLTGSENQYRTDRHRKADGL